jgi:hypothetical protein
VVAALFQPHTNGSTLYSDAMQDLIDFIDRKSSEKIVKQQADVIEEALDYMDNIMFKRR